MTDQTTLTTEEQAEIDRVAKVAERAPVAQQPLLAPSEGFRVGLL